jgi:hypothetical protein
MKDRRYGGTAAPLSRTRDRARATPAAVLPPSGISPATPRLVMTSLCIYGDAKASAERVLAVLADVSMPSDGPRPEQWVAVFRDWVDAGCPG